MKSEMMKVFGWVISWVLFWCGDAVSRCMHTGFTGWLYPVYNKLMQWSLDVQDWSEANGPWEDPN